MGRPRLAKEEKRRRGTLRPCREKEGEFAVVVPLSDDDYSPPPYLNDDGASEWRQKLHYLKGIRVLTEGDLGLLAALCLEWQLYLDAYHTLQKDGRYIRTMGKGGKLVDVKMHPAAKAADAHLERYIQLCNLFGLSPAARSKVKPSAEEKQESALDVLLKNAI
jgi:P27 family predicted phage terminase small subunit